MSKNICSICAGPYDGYGNNAEPVNSGRCCDDCNWSTVIPARLKGITKQHTANIAEAKTRMRQCRCGSEQTQRALHDGHGIFLTYVCDACEQKKLKGYRPDIMTKYDTDEPIEADDDELPEHGDWAEANANKYLK
jgi:hypothetical protein